MGGMIAFQPSTLASAPPPPVQAAVPRRRPTLLIVDADPGLQATLAILLENRAEVRGTACLAEATEHLASRTCSRIMLISENLLMSGFSNSSTGHFFEAVRSRAQCCLPVLLVDPARERDCITPFAIATVAAKPFAVDRLLRRLDDLLKRRGEPELWRDRMSVHVGRGLAFLACHYWRAPTLDEISSAACVSPSRLAHLFRDETGKSPKNYLARIRVEVAKRALLETDEKLDSVAERLGFCDAPHFSRVFRQYVGLWPGDFRRASLAFDGALQ